MKKLYILYFIIFISYYSNILAGHQGSIRTQNAIHTNIQTINSKSEILDEINSILSEKQSFEPTYFHDIERLNLIKESFKNIDVEFPDNIYLETVKGDYHCEVSIDNNHLILKHIKNFFNKDNILSFSIITFENFDFNMIKNIEKEYSEPLLLFINLNEKFIAGEFEEYVEYNDYSILTDIFDWSFVSIPGYNKEKLENLYILFGNLIESNKKNTTLTGNQKSELFDKLGTVVDTKYINIDLEPKSISPKIKNIDDYDLERLEPVLNTIIKIFSSKNFQKEKVNLIHNCYYIIANIYLKNQDYEKAFTAFLLPLIQGVINKNTLNLALNVTHALGRFSGFTGAEPYDDEIYDALSNNNELVINNHFQDGNTAIAILEWLKSLGLNDADSEIHNIKEGMDEAISRTSTKAPTFSDYVNGLLNTFNQSMSNSDQITNQVMRDNENLLKGNSELNNQTGKGDCNECQASTPTDDSQTSYYTSTKILLECYLRNGCYKEAGANTSLSKNDLLRKIKECEEMIQKLRK